ncbi:MAG TPA: ABC transporter substrate-binding protein [Solirubrobacteraceae bacterium]|nr:ABC transporter substrate-binding protein [Solirubrobacteraceae bacterium]
MLATALAACLLAVAGAGCGAGTSTARTPAPVRDATLILDFTPNAVHTGIYAALAQHYDRDEGVDLHVIAPTASTDSIKLLETGRVSFAILDIHDLAIARQQHQDIVGIMAIVERPLAAVIAAPAVSSPKLLQGKTVGVTGDPSDNAVLDSEVAGSGGDPAKVKTITIGFNAVADLLAGKVAGATAFWSDEGVTIRAERPGFHVFQVQDYGAPSYPELVVCVTRGTLEHDPTLIHDVVDTLVRGYNFTLADPARGAQELDRAVPSLDPRLVATQLNALLPAFRGPGGRVGVLDTATLGSWARWEARFGIVRAAPDVSTTFDPSFAAAAPVPPSPAPGAAKSFATTTTGPPTRWPTRS